ncbi:MAG: formate--tetrahydrofolate ligase [Armatimonadetes bacterium]|nr:formate--tetrahydrofolate ligase [Armatimonadota bacterium]
MLSDIEIAQQAELRPITDVAADLGLLPEELELYGPYKAKVSLSVLDRLADAPQAKYILVTAITPTPLGEGKTVTTIGLTLALRHLGMKAVTCIREPSMGPVFGIKGGACGGGMAQVVPMEDINLHFTGDIHAVAAANNLLAAMIDASLWHKNPLNLDPLAISWKRVVDLNDVALRSIVTGLGGRRGGVPRETGFDIAVASEVMAILALTTSLRDLRERMGRIWVGFDRDGKPVTAEDLRAAGAMTALMHKAIMPNLVQALDGGPALIHAGPFANIAIGCNSVLADQIGSKLADYVVTEAGFGADCGMEKFFNIKCRVSGLVPSAVVIVASIRALKMHGGAFKLPPGRKPPKEEIERENVEAVRAGCANLAKHIENVQLFGLPAVVAINRFPSDTDAEVEAVREEAMRAGAFACEVATVHRDGGPGGVELAQAVLRACERPADFRYLYELDWPIKRKIETIATQVYGAEGVDYLPEAEKKIQQFTELSLDRLPICMAKTHLSLSHDPALLGRPTGFRVPIRDIRASVGAGFLYPLLGEMRTMPALPTEPAAVRVDIDEEGRIVGLF